MADAPGARTALEPLAQAVATSELPVCLVDLGSLRLRAASPGALELLGGRDDGRTDVGILELTDEPDATRNALALMAQGAIEAYEARRRIRRPDGSAVELRLWVRALEREGYPDHALVLVMPSPRANGATDVTGLPRIVPGAPELVAGSTTPAGVVDRLTPDVGALLGGSGLREGAPLLRGVHPEDADELSGAVAQCVADTTSVGTTVRVRRPDGSWQDVRVVVSGSPTGDSRVGFSVTPEREREETRGETPVSAERLEVLERTLHRIANEVQALGIAPEMAFLPAGETAEELSGLTARQWEIVSRLLQGERVPSIARSMRLSQSTVRNHLSAVYRRLGVHSQQELIDRLRPR